MKFVPESMTRSLGSMTLKAQQSSPKILFAAGIVGAVGSTVLACRATLKIEEVLEETDQKMEKARDVYAMGREDYDSNDFNKDMAILYVRAAGKLCKLYAPAIVLGAASIACLTKSHQILNNRYAAVSAAYTGLQTAFENYRDRVRFELGEEKEKEIYHDVREEEREHPDTGKKVSSKESHGGSPYAFFFGPDTAKGAWQTTPEFNGFFLRSQQQYANDRLRTKGVLMLNDVLDQLGLPRTTAGCVVGWVWDGDGDNYVDFGMGTWPDAKDFIYGREDGVWLNFNCDGLVYKAVDRA